MRRHPRLAALLAFALAAVAFFPDVVFLGRTPQTAPLLSAVLGDEHAGALGASPVLDPAASAFQSEPWTRQIRDSIARGDAPLWNPHAGFGQPLAANGISGAFAPLRAPFLFFFPSPLLYDVFLLARLPLAAFLAFLFLHALGISWLGAVTGGGLFGFSDYFVLHVNMTHLDVEIFLPLLLLAAHRLARRPDSSAVAATALASLVAILGGNPESLAIALTLAAVFALAVTRERARTAILGAAGVALGIALSAPILLPTIELLANAAHAHPPSTGLACHEPRLLSVLLVPEILALFRPNLAADAPQLRWGAVGALPWILAAAAVAVPRERRPLAILFAAILSVALLKVFGAPPAQWLGLVPGLDRIVFPKYVQPAIALALAGLAALGVDALRVGRGRRAVAVAAALVIAATALLLPMARERALAVGAWPEVTRAALVEIALAGAALLATRLPGARAAFAVAILLAVDLRAHVPGGRPSRADVVDTPPPVVERLAAEPGPIRVVGLDGVLHPNWAGAFRISDLRTLDALTPAATLSWIRRRIQPIAEDRFTGTEPFPPDVFGRGIGDAGVGWLLTREPIEDHVTRFLASRAERRPTSADELPIARFAPSITVEPGAAFECSVLLARESPVLRARAAVVGSGEARVRVEIEPLGPRVVLFEGRPARDSAADFVSARRESIPLPRGDGHLTLEVDPPESGGDASAWIYWHDPRLEPHGPLVRPAPEGFPFRLSSPPGTYATPAVSDAPGAPPTGIFQRGPSTLRHLLRDDGGALEFSTAPVHWSAEPDRTRPDAPIVRVVWNARRAATVVIEAEIGPEGVAFEAPLDPFRGETVLLRLVVEGAAVSWSGLGVELLREPLEAIAIDGPVRLYRNREALPRALFVPASVRARSMREALEMASDPLFDSRRLVVLESDSAPGGRSDAAGAARVLSHRASAVEIEVDAHAPGSLLLLDAFYPGWRATVDGADAPVARANGAFRGVAVPAGRSVVRFEYAPASFRLGLVAAGLAAAVLLVMGARSRRGARPPRVTSAIAP